MTLKQSGAPLCSCRGGAKWCISAHRTWLVEDQLSLLYRTGPSWRTCCSTKLCSRLPSAQQALQTSIPSGVIVTALYHLTLRWRAVIINVGQHVILGDQSCRSCICRLEEALTIRELLSQNTEEIAGVVRALNGEYILPEAGGDLLRDGAGVLPTGQ